MYKIYRVECQTTGKFYYGKTKLTKEKKIEFQKMDINRLRKCGRGWNEILEHDNFNFEFIEEEIPEENVRNREAFYVNLFIDDELCVNKRKVFCDNYTKKDQKSIHRKNNLEHYANWQREYRAKNREKHKEYEKKRPRNVIVWNCKFCKQDMKLGSKKRHLKTQKHKINSKKWLWEMD